MQNSSTTVHIVGEDLFNYCTHSWRGFAGAVLQVVSFTVLYFKWSVKKHCVAKILQGIWKIFLYENNCNYNSYKFSYKSTLISFFSFRRNQKQESNIYQDGDLVTRNIYLFCFTIYFKGIPNSKDFYKRIFLHVIPARIIVPC